MPFIITAGIMMFTAVALGAFGAHGLRETLEAAGRISTWETAVLYHSLHGLALLALGVWRTCDPNAARSSALRYTGIVWMGGIALFSGSLYLLAVGGPRWLGRVTPFGGVLFLAGWVMIILAASKIPRSAQPRV